jgi:hypothetical protein
MQGGHTNVASRRCSRVHSDDNTTFESECKRSRTVLDFDPAAWIGVIIGMEAKEGGGLESS